MSIDKNHAEDHARVAAAIAEDWLAYPTLLVHLARDHGYKVEDINNAGLAVLIVMHDRAHGMNCFTEAEARTENAGLRSGLASLRRSTVP